jgi:hypothetical protein
MPFAMNFFMAPSIDPGTLMTPRGRSDPRSSPSVISDADRQIEAFFA